MHFHQPYTPTIRFATSCPSTYKFNFNIGLIRNLELDFTSPIFVSVEYNEIHTLLRFTFTNDITSIQHANRSTVLKTCMEIRNTYVFDWLFSTFTKDMIHNQRYKLLADGKNIFILNINKNDILLFLEYDNLTWTHFKSNASNLSNAVISIHEISTRTDINTPHNIRLANWTNVTANILDLPILKSATFDYDTDLNKYVIVFNRKFDYHKIRYEPTRQQYTMGIPVFIYVKLRTHFHITDKNKTHKFHLIKHPTRTNTAIINAHILSKAELI